MRYGTFIFPEQKASGFWRLQTDIPELIRKLKLRSYNGAKDKQEKGSHWKQTLWGTSQSFRRRFPNREAARKALVRFLQGIHQEGSSIEPETHGKGWVLKTPQNSNSGKKTPLGGSFKGGCNGVH